MCKCCAIVLQMGDTNDKVTESYDTRDQLCSFCSFPLNTGLQDFHFPSQKIVVLKFQDVVVLQLTFLLLKLYIL